MTTQIDNFQVTNFAELDVPVSIRYMQLVKLKNTPEDFDPALLNGFELSNGKIFIYNFPTKELYIGKILTYGAPIKTENLADQAITKEFLDMVEFENEDATYGVQVEGDIYVVQDNIELDKDYHWLGKVFKTPEDQMRYEEFLTDEFMFERMKEYCIYKKLIDKDSDIKEFAALPLHKKEPRTKEIAVHTHMINTFNQWQFSENLMRGFEKGTPEYELGLLCRLVPKFSNYILDNIKEENLLASEGYKKELNAAVKVVNKSEYLKSFLLN